MVGDVWPHIQSFLQSAVDRHGGWTLTALRRVVDSGGLLWVITDDRPVASVVTILTENHRGEKLCEVLACGGKRMNEWTHLMTDLEAYARAEGCNKISLSGRRGWGRMFQGFTEAHVTYEKRL